MQNKEVEQIRRQNAAKELRYKKPIMKELNLETIRETLYQMEEDCDEVAYAFNVADAEDLLNGMTGDEDDVYQFRSQFTDLSADLDNMQRDMDEEWIPECFDTLLAACAPHSGMLMGFDTYEGDYYGLGMYEEEYGKEEAVKKIERMTKKDIVEAAQQCFKVAFQFIALQSRYNDLKAAIDVIKGTNTDMLQAVKGIEAMWEQFDKINTEHPNDESWMDYLMDKDTARKWKTLCETLPAEAWLQ